MSKFQIVTFYTEDTPYEAEAHKMRDSANALGYKVSIYQMPNLGDWAANTRHKAHVVYEEWQEIDMPVVWVDADAIIQKRLWWFEYPWFDYACHIHKMSWSDHTPRPSKPPELNLVRSGTLFFGRGAGALLKDWAKFSEEGDSWDQYHLWEAMQKNWDSIEMEQLPMSYVTRNNNSNTGPSRDGVLCEDAVVLHTRGSKRFRKQINEPHP